MTLNISGGLLEGIRTASGNNPFTFPPRSVIQDQTILDESESLGRAEYMLFAAGQSSGAAGLEIADPNLSVIWSRNDATVTRFDYDTFKRRWNTMPGGAPAALGAFGNSPRLVSPVPDQTVSSSESPFAIFVGLPRQVTFVVEIVESESDFGNPPAGTVQISLDEGQLNFGTVDLNHAAYVGQTVYVSQQSFNNRTKSNGVFGQLPASASESYNLYLNPIPGVGQTPRIRIGYQAYLTSLSYATESVLTTPPTGSVAWSQDTGRVLFSLADITANVQSNVYYDGVTLGQVQFVRTTIGDTNSFYPIQNGTESVLQVINLDPLRYVFFAEPVGKARYYFTVVLGNSVTSSLSGPSKGQVLIDVATGNIYISQSDSATLGSSPFFFLDSTLPIERGVGVQFYRSGVNVNGPETGSDFVEKYLVIGQIIQAGITGSPSVGVTTIPVVDSTLQFDVIPTTGGGTFSGELVNSADPTQLAFGYSLDLDNRQIKFTNRKTVIQTLLSATSSIKLQDSAIISAGFSVTRDSAPLTPGVDFQFNINSGLLDFLQPVGEDDPNNILDIAGATQLPNLFSSNESQVFSNSNIGMFLFISSGPNVGLRQITAVIAPNQVSVSSPFLVSESDSADVRADREIVADRFFTNFTPPLKKFTLQSAPSINGPFTVIDQSQFSVLLSTGQVNLSVPAQPGQVFQISYVWNQSPDDGVTVTPTNVTEFASFKIRQESGTVTIGTNAISFNPNGSTVQPGNGITLYIDGVSQDPSSFTFTAPGTLNWNQTLTSTNVVTIDYFVAESPGGNTSFFLANNPVDIDYPQIVAGSLSSTFNGNQTSLLSAGGAFLIGGVDIVMIGAVTYDPTSDTTTVSFNFAPASYSNGIGAMQVCAPIAGTNAPGYMVTETNPVDMLPKGANVLSVHGQVNYPGGTIALLDGDPYLVASSSYSPTLNVTSVTLSDRALRNYIISILQHTIRPVFQAGTDFQSAQTATLAFPFTLVRDGSRPAVLIQGVDYTVSDGGTFKLTAPAQFGDVLEVLYVARAAQPVGTVFTFNYAYLIAPNATNGILSQNLSETYNLYSPDTFFFDIETILSFIPTVIQELQQSASSGAAGPNIQSKTTLQTKDQGFPSLYWSEQHIGNEDIVIQRLLQFYNDLINNYEDILSNIDGRVVGGVDGKFRFNGEISVVTTFAQITNDIDDEVVLYNNLQLTSFTPFTFSEVPVYGFMYQPNNLSRIYPTLNPFVTIALNNKQTVIIDYGQTIGSTNINNITSISTLSSSRASSPITSAVISGTSTIVTVVENGDTTDLIPQFSSGQSVQLYNPDGSPNGSLGTVSSVAGLKITISGVEVSLQKGGLTQNTSSGHFYVPGRDCSVNNDNGTLQNNALPPPFNMGQTAIVGNELVDSSVTFVNSDVTPRRIPVLDGSTLSDNGRPAVPPLSRIGELDYLGYESASLPFVGFGSVDATGLIVSAVGSNPFRVPAIGQTIVFLNGPNAGLAGVVFTVASTSFTINAPAFPSEDSGSDFYTVLAVGDLSQIVAGELNVLNNSVERAAITPALIGSVNSELVTIGIIIQSFGQAQASSLITSNPTGSGTTLVDADADFATAEPPINSSSLLYVNSGANQGLYQITSVTDTTITINPTAPFPSSFPSSGAYSPYIIISPWSFLSQSEVQFATSFLAATLSFYLVTLSWSTSISASGVPGRQAALGPRLSALPKFVSTIEGLLGSTDNLYDTRYLWIQERTDKTYGTLIRQVQAMNQRIASTTQLIADQQKLLVIESLPTS